MLARRRGPLRAVRDGGARRRRPRVVVGLGDVHREVHVDAAAAALEPDLRAPEADAGAVAGHHPDRLAIRPAVDDRQAEHAGVERLGGLEVDHLEDEFAHTGDGDAHRRDSAEPVARVDGWRDFTAAERARLRPAFLQRRTGRCSRSWTCRRRSRARMFARYSRYQGTLRRLFLDEFADSLPAARRPPRTRDVEGARAAELFERIFVGYGDDSVAQLGGAHIAVRVGLERAHEGPPAPAAGGVPGAVHALHRLRRADARRRLPLLPRRGARPGVRRGRWTRCSTPTRRRCRACARGWTRRSRPRPASPRRSAAARSRPRRWTCCAGCCPPRRSRTWASTRPARPTSS